MSSSNTTTTATTPPPFSLGGYVDPQSPPLFSLQQHNHNNHNINNQFDNNNYVNNVNSNVNNIVNNNNVNSNNNNNGTNDPIMERVSFHLHLRVCNFGLTHTSCRTRKIVEHILLIIAIMSFGALMLLHRSFVVTTTGSNATCLDRLHGFNPSAADITHLIILPQHNYNKTDHVVNVNSNNNNNNNNNNKEEEEEIVMTSQVLWNRRRRQRQQPQPQMQQMQQDDNRTTTTNDENESSSSNCDNKDDTDTATCSMMMISNDHSDDSNSSNSNSNSNSNCNHDSYHRRWLEQQIKDNTLPIHYSYSTTKGYLMLPYNHKWFQQQQNSPYSSSIDNNNNDSFQLDVQYILISPTDPQCFGEPFVQFLLWHCYVGVDTVLYNWILTFQSFQSQTNNHHDFDSTTTTTTTGYVYNPRTKRLQELGEGYRSKSNNNISNDATTKSASSFFSDWYTILLNKIGVFCKTLFLFFFCTTLVSFTLRETQERMLDFTKELSRRVRASLRISDLITTHVVTNLVFVPIMVGMMFFLIEFYDGDKFLAFSILSIIWFVEGFSLVSLRSIQGIHYFPYFFFLLFLLFHVYQSAFQYNGFVYVALTVVWCFILHSIMFFWHRYELPAIVLGNVTINRPRMIDNNSNNNGSSIINNNHANNGNNVNVNNNNNNNNSSNNNNDSSSGSTFSMTTQQQQQQNLWHLHGPPPDGDVTDDNDNDDGNSNNHTDLTTPIFTPPTATLARGPLLSSGLNDNTTRGGGLQQQQQHSQQRASLGSFQSFQSTASSRNSGLYRANNTQDYGDGDGDDNSSTGSLLYFMGGEVVVRRDTSTTNVPSASASTTRSNTCSVSSNNKIVIESGSEESMMIPMGEKIGGRGGRTSGISTANLPRLSPPILLSRNESNFSLLSSSSDVYHTHAHDHAVANGCSSSNSPHNDNSNNNNTIGLDMSEHLDDDDPYGSVENNTSMDTISASNVTATTKTTMTPPKCPKTNSNDDNDDDDYAQESGGLQAIFESRLTPRHRNTTTIQQQKQQQRRTISEQPGTYSSSSSPSFASRQQLYQRSPPTFPELSQQTTK